MAAIYDQAVARLPKGPEEFPLDRLAPDQFEVLTFLLARDAFPGPVHVRRKDHGLDARLPDTHGATVRGWQSKRFLDRIYWDQCQESVARALAFWRPLRITFVFPKVLSGKEQKEFQTELIDHFPRVRLDWWDASELQPRMRDTPGGRRAADWLFGNPEADKAELQRVLAVGGELSDAADAAARIAEVQKFMSRDPHFRYTAVAREADAPDIPAAEQTIASVEANFGGVRVRFDAAERYPGGATDFGLRGTLAFSEDDEGRRARDAVMRVVNEGGTIEVSSGMSAKLAALPVGFRGLLPDDEMTGRFQFSAVGEPQPVPLPSFPILVRAGAAEIGAVLNYIEPIEGWNVTLAGSAGGLELFMSFRGEGRDGERQMDWRWTLGDGSALEQLLAAEVMLATYRGDTVTLITPADGKVVAELAMARPDGRDDEFDEIEGIRDFLGYAADVEAWLGVPLYPPARPTEADASILSWLVAQIRTPEREGTLTRLEVVLSRPAADFGQLFQIAVGHPLRASLFGEDRYLGMQQIHVPRARFDGIAGAEQPGDTVAIVPADSEVVVTTRFYSPTVAPERQRTPSSERNYAF